MHYQNSKFKHFEPHNPLKHRFSNQTEAEPSTASLRDAARTRNSKFQIPKAYLTSFIAIPNHNFISAPRVLAQ